MLTHCPRYDAFSSPVNADQYSSDSAAFTLHLDGSAHGSIDQIADGNDHVQLVRSSSSSARSPLPLGPIELDQLPSETATLATPDLLSLHSPTFEHEPEDEWIHEPEETAGDNFREHHKTSHNGGTAFHAAAAGTLINLREMRRELQIRRISVDTKQYRLHETIRGLLSGLRGWLSKNAGQVAVARIQECQNLVNHVIATEGENNPQLLKDLFAKLRKQWFSHNEQQQDSIQSVMDNLDNQQTQDTIQSVLDDLDYQRTQIEDDWLTLQSDERRYDALETEFIQDEWTFNHRVQEVSSSPLPTFNPAPNSSKSHIDKHVGRSIAISRWLAATRDLDEIKRHHDQVMREYDATVVTFASQSLSELGVNPVTAAHLEELDNLRSSYNIKLYQARIDVSHWQPLVLDDTETLFHLHQFYDQDAPFPDAILEFPSAIVKVGNDFVQKLSWDQELYADIQNTKYLNGNNHMKSHQLDGSLRMDEWMNNWFWSCLEVSFLAIRVLTVHIYELSIPVRNYDSLLFVAFLRKQWSTDAAFVNFQACRAQHWGASLIMMPSEPQRGSDHGVSTSKSRRIKSRLPLKLSVTQRNSSFDVNDRPQSDHPPLSADEETPDLATT